MEDDTITWSLPIKTALAERIDDAHINSPFTSRLEFIRFLLDMALTEYERYE